MPIYDGSHTAAARNVVVVTTNYRLGYLGFAGCGVRACARSCALPRATAMCAGDVRSSDQLRAHNAADGSTGCYGLQDQRAAMQWVRTNIHLFGGDASKLFVFGESAGSHSTAMHLVAPRSRGLFAAAGMESGAYGPWGAYSLAEANQEFASLAERAGCPAPPDNGTVACLLVSSPQPLLVLCMRRTKALGRNCGTCHCQALSATDLLALQESAHIDFGVVVDGVELPAHPNTLAQNGAALEAVRCAYV